MLISALSLRNANLVLERNFNERRILLYCKQSMQKYEFGRTSKVVTRVAKTK